MRVKSTSWFVFLLLSSIAFGQVSYFPINENFESDTISTEWLQRGKLLQPAGPFCITDAPVTLIASTPGGVWSGNGISDPNAGTFNPSFAGPGDHLITYISIAGTETLTIHVDAAVDATIAPAGPFCETNAPINLNAADSGGVWSGDGITDPNAGTFDPALALSGIHLITYLVINGQCSDTDTEPLIVDVYSDSDWALIGPFCFDDSAVDIVPVTAGGAFFGTGITDGVLGTFDPVVAGEGTRQVSYSIVNGVCTSVTHKDVIVYGEVDATIIPAGPYCDNENIVNLSGADPGGVWSGPGIVNTTTGAFDPENAGPGIHTIQYDIVNGGCGDVDTEDILVYLSPDADFPPIDDVCETDPPFDIIPVNFGGVWSGVGITDVNNGTFDPSVSGPGSFMVSYLITNANCSSLLIRRVNVDTLVVATITPAGPFCESDSEVILTAADIGGVWTGTGITNSLTGAFDPGLAAAGTHTITYEIIAGACEDIDNADFVVLAAPDATINDPGEFCNDDPAVNLIAATPGGVWAGTGITDPINGTFDPSVANGGANDITYTVSNASCTSVGNITIFVYDDAVDATITSTGPYCISGGLITLTAVSPGGIWSGTGIVNSANGIFDPVVAGVGSQAITYDVGNPACFDTDNQIIQVDDTLSAIINPVATVCENDPAFNLTAANPGGVWSGAGITVPLNGTFDPLIATSGIHTITYTLTQGACTNIDSIDIQVDAGVDATITPAGPYCETDASENLNAADPDGVWSGTGITNPLNGTFDPLSATPGIHIITYTITNGTCSDIDTESLTVYLFPDSDWFDIGPFCEGDGAVNILPVTSGGVFSGTGITDGVLGTFEPSVAESGTHQITYTFTNGTCVSTTTKPVIVYDDVDATINPAGPFCDNTNIIALSATELGGTWSGLGIINPDNGAFDPSLAGAGVHPIAYELNNANCSDSDTLWVVVYLSPVAEFDVVSDICETDPPFDIIPLTLGGTWSGNGIIDPINGTFDPSDAGPGSHMITYTMTNLNCSAVCIRRFDVDPAVDATITPAGPFCQNDPEQILTAADPGGTWSGTGITNASTGAFNPALAIIGINVITYGVSAGACEDTATANIIVDIMPNSTINPAGPFCSSDPVVTLTAISPGGTWSGDGVDPMTGDFDPGYASGDHTITYEITNGACTSQSTIVIHVDAEVDATITPVGIICEYEPAFDLVGADPGGVWSGIGITNVVNGTFDAATVGPGLYPIDYIITNGTCFSSDTEVINVGADPVSTIFGAGPFCSNEAAVNLVSVTPGGDWLGDGTNPVTGVFDPDAAGGGDHLITYTLTVGACTNSSSITIHVDAAVDATITPAGPFCLYDPAENLSAVSSGGTWTGTGILDPSTGTFDPQTAGVGIYNIGYNIVNGLCSDSDNIFITVNNAPDGTINDPGEFCSTDPPINLTAVTPGGSWGGNGITNAVNGTFDPGGANDGANDVTYTVSSGGCTTVGTITIYVYDAAVDATITSTGPYCISAGLITLTAVSSGGVWSGTGIVDVDLGTFDPTAAVIGNNLITYDVGNPACFDTDSQIIQVDDTLSAIINPVAPLCEDASQFDFTAANPGGLWSGTGNGITNAVNGTFNPVLAGDGTHIITYTISQGVCTNIDTFDMLVDADVDATITPAGPFCENDLITTLVAADSGGTWGGTGIVNTVEGYFHPPSAVVGDNNITYSLVNGTCSDSDAEIIHIDAFPITTISAAGPFCESDSPINLNAASPGGLWSGTGITDVVFGTFDPSLVVGGGSSLIDYEITNGACYSSSTRTIVVDEFYDATITPAGPFCNTDAFVNLTAATAGGDWSGTGITSVLNGTFHPGIATPGDWLIDYQISNGVCSDSDNITIHVDQYFDATISAISDFCETEPAVNLVAANPGGVWSGTGIIFPAVGTFDPGFVVGGGDWLIYYEITNGACYSSDTETVHVDNQPDPTISPVGPICQNQAAFDLTAADGGGDWTGIGIIDADDGTFNPGSVVAPGNYIITYDIVNGECSASDTETIHVDLYPNTILSPAGPFCETDAVVNLPEPSIGGLWSGNGITDLVTGLFDPPLAQPGTHPIDYTIINGACTSTGTINIVVNSSVDATITDVGPFCETDGSIILTAVTTGGAWSGSGVSPVTGSFSPGNALVGNNIITYYVENGVCNDTDNTTIVVEAAPEVTILTTGPFCETEGNQVFTADVAGGVWSGDGIDMLGTFNPGIATVGVHPIIYTFTSGSCIVTEQVDITVNEYFDAEISSTGPYCLNDTPLYLSSINSGGVWSGDGTNLDGLFSPAAAGVSNHIIGYEITNGACYDDDTQIISVNNNPDATISGPSDVCLNDPIFNYTSGDSGGTWSGAGITDVVAGTYNPQASGVGNFLVVYEITVNGCSSIDFDTLTVHDIPVVTISGLNPDYCLNDDSHLVNVSPAGGVLTGGAIAGTLFDPQLAGVGTHNITYVYSDLNSCTDTAEFDLEVHAMPVTSISGIDDYYCVYDDTVYPVVLPLGGTLVGAGTYNNLFIPPSAGPGDFELMYHFTDVFGCSDTTYVNTTVVDYADVDFDVTQPLCFGDSNGTITTTVTNAIGPFDYLWSDAGPSVTADITSVLSSWYYLSVTDSLSCVTVDSVFVDEPTQLVVDISSFSDASCYGFEDAWAIANASGGIPGYTYLWDDTEHTDTVILENIPIGPYIVIVTDSNLCQATDTIVIGEPDTLSLSFIDIFNVSCYTYSDGAVTVEPAGGTGPYDAIWNDQFETLGMTITNLVTGYYTVIITDDHDCEFSDSVLITEPDSLYLEAVINPVLCTQQMGSVGITVFGGTAPYDYLWSTEETLPVLFNLISQTYDVIINDANGCVLQSSVDIPTEGGISVDITQTNYNLCYGDKIAELVASSPDAANPCNYYWSNYIRDSVNPDLAAGDYIVTLIDSWGCQGIDSITVSEPVLLEVQVHSEDVLCKGELTGTASVEIQGGTQAYSVLWENDDTNFYTVGLGAGEIWVTVTDANNCVETAYSVITEPATGIEIDLNVQQVTCYGANDGAINSFASGGTPPYLYTWYINGMELSGATIKNLDVGTYILMVYDNNGCSTDTIVQLFQVNSLVADVEVGNTSCIGNYDGYISITAQGGTKPYSYYLMDMLWDSPIIDSLYRGEYYLTVIDSNYCEYNFGPIVIADTDEDCLKIPAAFSPNGDGYNDEFFIENIHLYPRAVIQIFNRWGQLLYEDLGLNGFWDGTYSGNPVPTGAYLYNIILNIDEDPRVGTITLIR